MTYILMTLSILFSVTSSCVLRCYGNSKKAKNTGDIFLFNSFVSVLWAILIFFVFLFSRNYKISPQSIIFGTVYGFLLAFFLLTKTLALKEGPVSLTTLIGSCAFIIAVWFGAIYNKEPINYIQYIGMALLIVSLVLCINPKKSGDRLTPRWFLYAFLFFIAGGFVGIFYKFLGASSVSNEVNAVMLIASIVSAVLFFILGLIINSYQKEPCPKIHKGTLKYILLVGIFGCIYQRLNLSLSAVIPAVIFFPVSNGSMVLLSASAGKIFFREKLKKSQLAGIILGLFSIIIIGISDVICGIFI